MRQLTADTPLDPTMNFGVIVGFARHVSVDLSETSVFPADFHCNLIDSFYRSNSMLNALQFNPIPVYLYLAVASTQKNIISVGTTTNNIACFIHSFATRVVPEIGQKCGGSLGASFEVAAR
jgi:hypothetical protein